MSNKAETKSVLDFIKNGFRDEKGVVEFFDGKKLCIEELDTAVPVSEKNGRFSEIWFRKDLKRIYILNLSGLKKGYRLCVSNFFGDNDILFHDIYSGMVYKSENGVIYLSMDAYDIVCLHPNSLLYKMEYEF